MDSPPFIFRISQGLLADAGGETFTAVYLTDAALEDGALSRDMETVDDLLGLEVSTDDAPAYLRPTFRVVYEADDPDRRDRVRIHPEDGALATANTVGATVAALAFAWPDGTLFSVLTVAPHPGVEDDRILAPSGIGAVGPAENPSGFTVAGIGFTDDGDVPPAPLAAALAPYTGSPIPAPAAYRFLATGADPDDPQWITYEAAAALLLSPGEWHSLLPSTPTSLPGFCDPAMLLGPGQEPGLRWRRLADGRVEAGGLILHLDGSGMPGPWSGSSAICDLPAEAAPAEKPIVFGGVIDFGAGTTLLSGLSVSTAGAVSIGGSPAGELIAVSYTTWNPA